ncbi:adenosylcobinamide-GDP ribazoletransferase [Leptospira sp. 2 VSF19]|uniref:Adenosylcobinamide-GDP ribazoletransferase n=1 Tax=Leptospira soteropolitanensis TaxID=2950025 RepID=A0AAW5VJ50_9LEPT|nr:adenosylcobinamide-GDP ribazoletransferase [Leptospira soteropolitanensis]MCW7491049.1 adenosylcobinamide-GDP ribazoletransferase [Leptospira soteropolitanensis]MCW7498633.1 adenosylcobinamide-GDP ribazoletransferase [Leptospira soteropolitanensis]MCW7521774.1 adenosylcobinamide-GDP ribazoletransferase [Leptospira soteropolitanensis]MCW7524737.1 adenosylcobinamide-GDP ribazoletransferase [Leptospira soteropolitanensis]MCW7528604.1 adenosylcobinamide-GDP ribazoletransferase [Leptospira soter
MNWIITEIRLFFVCLSFLSRIPSPKWIGFKEDWLHKSIKYSPTVGIVLGFLQWTSFTIFQMFFGPGIAFVISLGFLLILTGAFHEDGFSDFCDGIGGGWKREDILRIMKDSRVGSFGAAGISLLLILKIFGGFESLKTTKFIWNQISLEGLYQLTTVLLYFLSAHSFSRFFSVLMMKLLPYAKEEGYAKPMAKEITWPQTLFASISGLFPFAVLVYLHPKFSLSLVLILPCLYYMYSLMKRWIGGFTGDCLGATQQVVETCLWISGVFIWTSI